MSVAQAEAEHKGELRGLGALLGLRQSQILTVANSLPLQATFSWGDAGKKQYVRASDRLYRTSRWDHVRYHDEPGGPVQHGRACLIVQAIDAVPTCIIIVHKLITATARPNCVLSQFGCQRLR